MAETEVLFRDDAYLRDAEAKVVRINDRGGIVLDRTIFYATSGGQPGDTGFLERAGGKQVAARARRRSSTFPRPAPRCPRQGRRFAC